MIALARPRFGDTRIWILLRLEGWRDNKKRVHRLYRLGGLQVRMRPRRKKRLSLHRGVVPAATRADQHWSMDFVHDQLATGRTFPVLTVDNAFIESFNGRVRDECLNVHSVVSLAHAQAVIAQRRQDYNDQRPHGSLGRLDAE